MRTLSQQMRPAVYPATALAVLLVAALLAVALPARPAQAASPPAYAVTVLHAVTGEFFAPSDRGNPVNGAGLVAGYVFNSRDPAEAAVFDTRTSTVRKFGYLNYSPITSDSHYSVATDVNIRGDVVGTSSFGDGSDHAFVVPAGSDQLIDLGVDGGTEIDSGANAVNDRGVIAGYQDVGLSTVAVTWTLHPDAAPTRADIGTAIGSMSSVAISLNNAGYVLVARWDTGYNRNIVWFPRQRYAMPIKPLPGDDTTLFSDINSAGYAVGTSSKQGTPDDHAMLWSSKTRTSQRLPVPGVRADPVAINDRGEIIGNEYPLTSDTSNHSRPVIWGPYGSSARYLATGSSTDIIASGINVYGQVVGQNGRFGITWVPSTTATTTAVPPVPRASVPTAHLPGNGVHVL
ncbi:hypothetical protein [uncultured Friedmanniella sp.]|uniref:hypothetical protein n=1 Tax=uncultured Friedmanniella sp. TaxID=335381 RepID=UPI0035CC9908